MHLNFQALALFLATVSAIRHAHFARQLESCGVSCGDGWCCFEFENCVPNPGDALDGGWSCIVQGISNDDGSPLTDIPYNPSADNGFFSSINAFISDQSSFISALTSEFTITSLPIPSVTAISPITLVTTPDAGSASATLSRSASLAPSPVITASTGASSITPRPPQISTSNAHNSHRWKDYRVSLVLCLVAATIVYFS